MATSLSKKTPHVRIIDLSLDLKSSPTTEDVQQAFAELGKVNKLSSVTITLNRVTSETFQAVLKVLGCRFSTRRLRLFMNDSSLLSRADISSLVEFLDFTEVVEHSYERGPVLELKNVSRSFQHVLVYECKKKLILEPYKLSVVYPGVFLSKKISLKDFAIENSLAKSGTFLKKLVLMRFHFNPISGTMFSTVLRTNFLTPFLRLYNLKDIRLNARIKNTEELNDFCKRFTWFAMTLGERSSLQNVEIRVHDSSSRLPFLVPVYKFLIAQSLRLGQWTHKLDGMDCSLKKAKQLVTQTVMMEDLRKTFIYLERQNDNQ